MSEFFSTADVVRILQIDRRTFDQHLKKGKCAVQASARIGTRSCYTLEDLEALRVYWTTWKHFRRWER